MPLIEQLRYWVADDQCRREKDVQPFLSEIRHALGRDGTPLYWCREERTMHGNADFCVSVALAANATRAHCAYVWEVKAPQLHAFVYDDAKRLSPTIDLIKAETQLFYYVRQFRKDPTFKELYMIDEDDQIVPGGIIIGREKDFFKWSGDSQGFTDHQKSSFGNIARRLRELFVYDKIGLWLRDWDWVIERLDARLGGLSAVVHRET